MGCSNSRDRIVIPYRHTSLVMRSYCMRGLRWDLNPSWDVRIVQVESTWDSTQELFLHGLELNMIKRQVITETDFVSGSSDIIIPMSELRHFIFLLELFGCHIKTFLLNRFVVFYHISNHFSLRQNSFKCCLHLSMEIKHGWNLSKGTPVF